MAGIELFQSGNFIFVRHFEEAERCYLEFGFSGANFNGLKGGPVPYLEDCKSTDKAAISCLQPYSLTLEEAHYLTKKYPRTFIFTSDLPVLSSDRMLFRLSAYTFLRDTFGTLLSSCTPLQNILVQERLLKQKETSRKCVNIDDSRYKCWTVKEGAKYGVDYLLYQGEPGKVHSSFGVIIDYNTGCSDDSRSPEKGKVNRSDKNILDWRFITSACRVMDQVNKKLVIVSSNSLHASFCPSIEACVISRWIPINIQDL